MEKFEIGELANYSIRGDTYPVRVISVSPSGKTVTVCSVSWKVKPEVPRELGMTLDIDDVADVETKKDSKPEVFRYSKKYGLHIRSQYFILRRGFSYHQDPHV